MQPVDLKHQIYNLLTEDVGTYKINNQLVPSIWIGQPPNNFQKTGLEILIPATTSMSQRRGQIQQNLWEVYLIQHKAGNQTLHSALEKLIKLPNYLSHKLLPAILSGSVPDFIVLDQIEIKFTDYKPL